MSLTNQIISAVENGEDIGSLNVLRRYEKDRYFVNQTMMSAVDALKFLFESNLAPVSVLRGLGLSATNALGPFKNQLASIAFAENYNLNKIQHV